MFKTHLAPSTIDCLHRLPILKQWFLGTFMNDETGIIARSHPRDWCKSSSYIFQQWPTVCYRFGPLSPFSTKGIVFYSFLAFTVHLHFYGYCFLFAYKSCGKPYRIGIKILSTPINIYTTHGLALMYMPKTFYYHNNFLPIRVQKVFIIVSPDIFVLETKLLKHQKHRSSLGFEEKKIVMCRIGAGRRVDVERKQSEQ